MRLFLSAAAAVVVAGCLGCGSAVSSSGIQLNRSLRNLIWPETSVLAGVDIEALQKTEFYRRHSQQLNFPIFEEATARLGFDPRREVKLLVLQSDTLRTVLLAEGNLKRSQIQQKLVAAGAKSTAYHSFQILGDEGNALVFLDKSVAAAGSTQDIRFAADVSEKRSGSLPADLQSQLETITKGSQVWIVSSKGLPFAGMAMRSDVQSALSNIVSYIASTTAGLHVDTGTQLTARFTCISPAGAQRVHDALRGGIGLARLSTKDDQSELLKVYDAIQVDQKGNLVDVKAALGAGELDKLMTFLPQTQGQAR